MGSPEITVPIIDFSSQELKAGTSTWESVKAQVRSALEEFGCFQALYDKIPELNRKELFDLVAEFFDRPLEEKAKNRSDKVYDGYIGTVPDRPLGESLSFAAENVESLIDSVRPQQKSNVRDTVNFYVEALSELDRTIRTMVLESFGLDKYIDEQNDSIEYNVRFMKYKPPDTNGTEIGLASHADKTLVSILDQYGTKGLELLTKDGQWIEVNFPPNSLCVLLGELFLAWSNGRLPAPFHRVTMSPIKQSRYTVGFFSLYKPGYMIKSPKELEDEEHPQQFKPFEINGLMDFYKEAGFLSTIKDYCGV